MTDELDDLTNLIKSPGWQRWCQWAVQEAQNSVEAEMVRALDNDNDAVAAGRMRQAIAGKRAIERAIQRPAERVQALHAKAETVTTPTSYRRGGL